MSFWDNLVLGFTVAGAPINLLFCFIGALLGTLIGVLPGIGPLTTIALLLPMTYYLDPVTSLVMLAGIYYGAQYGGSITSILLNLPGEASSVVTCLDGHQMARQGRAGAALAIAAIGSFAAGCISTLAIAIFSAPLASVAMGFRPADYCALIVFGLVAAVALAQGSTLKALGMVVIGLILGTVGTDVNSGDIRYAFGIPQLADGLDFVVVAMALFGLAEIVVSVPAAGEKGEATRFGRVFVTRDDMRKSWKPIMRGSALGTILGVLPGGGALLASFAAYSVEKQIAADPTRFGKGAIEGVAAPESANNAGAQTSFIPLLTLGVPSNVLIALMAGAMIIHGIVPGPNIISEQPRLFWGLVASMWIGNLMLLFINLPLVRIWVALLAIPYRILFPAIVLFCCVGAFSLANSGFNVLVMSGFGLFGFVLKKLDCEPAPLMLGFVLGPMLEQYLGRALLLARGDWTVFLTRPISLSFLVLAVLLAAVVCLPSLRRHREEVFTE